MSKMKIYQVPITSDCDTSDGYKYFPTWLRACNYLEETKKKMISEYGDLWWLYRYENEKIITEIEFKLTKNGILNLMNAWASYPDNG